MASPQSQPIRILQIGLGPIGQRMVRDAVQRGNLTVVGAVDIDPLKIGKDLGEVCGMQKLGVLVSDGKGIQSVKADVAVLTTVSDLNKLWPVLKLCIAAKKHVVSTCEELAYPFKTHPKLAAEIDAFAKKNGVAVLATGINPGFLMDALPVFFTAISQKVTEVKVERMQDARIRRLPFQQKIGAGLPLHQFLQLRDAGKIKHVGFTQSLHMIAAAFGWELDKTEDIVEPVIATEDVSSPLLKVPAGTCAGVKQCGNGYMNGKKVITLEMQAYNGLKDPRDTVHLYGEPNLETTIKGGAHGDTSTTAVVLNAIPSVVKANPGLRVMTDIPLAHWHL